MDCRAWAYSGLSDAARRETHAQISALTSAARAGAPEARPRPGLGLRAIGCTATTKVIDGRVAKRAVEPRHYRLVRRRLVGMINHLGKGVLEDVLGQFPIAHAPFEEPQECTMVLEQRLDHNSIL
jgi:hypothetical protein